MRPNMFRETWTFASNEKVQAACACAHLICDSYLPVEIHQIFADFTVEKFLPGKETRKTENYNNVNKSRMLCLWVVVVVQLSVQFLREVLR